MEILKLKAMFNRQNLPLLNFRVFFVILILILGFFVLPAKPLLADEEEPITIITESTSLTQDIAGPVVIQAGNLTLDCQGRKITGSGPDSGSGVYLEGWDKIVIKNCLIENFDTGIDLWCSNQNQIFENIVADNGLGININCSCAASDNLVYHNNFKNNYEQARLISGDNDLFDNGWPEGGNYWSDYTGEDLKQGENQNQDGSDGIGDANYIFSGGEDRYPFVKENGWKEETPEWRKDIQPGDILYDPFASGVGHIGLYIGDSRVIEAQGILSYNDYPGKVNDNPITVWDYPQRNTVYLLRVKKPDDLNNTEWNQKIINAINFVKFQNEAQKPYDWHWYQKQYDIDSPSWYCSELVWAAYYNQGIDLEYRANGVAFDLIDPVSPVEIFDDKDTDTISSHLEGFNSTPWYRQFAPLLVLSPVNVIITDKNGNTIDQSGVNIPGATFIENQTDASGHKYSIIYLPLEYGPYQIKVTRKSDANDEDIYSLKTETESGDIWLAQNHPVPAENEKDEYNFDPAALNDNPATGSFNDTEESSGNTYQAGALDATATQTSFSYTTGTAPMEPGDIITKAVNFENDGNLAFQYKVKYFNAGGGDLCDALLLTAKKDSTVIYNKLPLKDFDTGSIIPPIPSIALNPTESDDWEFILELPASPSQTLENQTCDFNFKFTAWQTDFIDKTSGFWDEELADPGANIEIKTGEWFNPGEVVINELMWMGSRTDDNNNKTADEWIELKNTTGHNIDIKNWDIDGAVSGSSGHLEISGNGPTAIIPANGYYLIANKDKSDSLINVDVDEKNTNINFNNEYDKNGQVVLKDKGGNIIDSAPIPLSHAWPAGINDNDNNKKWSMERNSALSDGALNSSWHTCNRDTMNATDLATMKSYWDSNAQNYNCGTPGHANLSPVVVMNEIMFNPSGENKEWAELYNISDKDIDVSGWYFENNRGDKTVISEENSDNNGNLDDKGETEVPSGGRLVVYFEKEYFGNEKDEVSLYNGMGTPDDEKDDVREDVYNYENADVFPEDKTFSRIPDGVGIWIDPEATPGKENKLSEKETDAFRLLTFEKCFDDEGNLNKNNQAEICAPAFLEYLGMIDDLDDKKINGSTELKVLKLKKEEEEKKLADLLKETEEMIAGQKNAIEPGSAEETIPQNGLNQEAETGTEKEKTVLEEETKENDKVEKEEKPVEVKVKVSGKLDLAGGLKIKDQDLKIKEVEILGWKKDKAKIKINLDKLDKVKKAGKVKVKIKDLDLPGKAEVISHKKDKVVLEIEVVEVKADKKTEEKVEDKTDIKAIKKIEVIDNSLKKENEE